MKIINQTIVIALYILCSIFIGRIYRADVYAKKSEIALKQLEIDDSLTYARKAAKLNPNEPYYQRAYGKALLTKSLNNKAYKSQVLNAVKKAEKLNGINLATLRNNVPIYYYLALEDITSKKKANNNIDTYYYKEAERYFKQVKTSYPDDLGVAVLIAKHELLLGMTAEHAKSIENITRLRPDILNWYQGLN